MSNLLFIDDEETYDKVDIDGLYEKKQQRDLKQLSIFNKILNRIHKKINHTGKNKSNDKHIFYTVPEFIFGEPLYNQGDCIGYLVVKLEENGFAVRYMHPNTLFISWKNWIPSYVREQVKKKTGKIIDEKGNIVTKNEIIDDEEDINSRILNTRKGEPAKQNKEFTPIQQYKPSGNLVYNNELFERLEKKL
tara:strand:- start:3207 stop:3779 length:573 start_codon:yes stop_codon:yes gene_type:complete